MRQYFRIYKDQFNENKCYWVIVTENKNDTFTLRNKATYNPIYEDINEMEKNRLLENWIEYNKEGIIQNNKIREIVNI